MTTGDERAVRRALVFAQTLEHENLVKLFGTWEESDAIYLVEEYASKGDIQQVSSVLIQALLY